MNKPLVHILRIFLGSVFLIAGINGYFVILGLEPFIETSPQAMELFQFQYLLIFEKSLEIICAVLLLSNRYVPLALALLSPILANIFLLHLFKDHSLLALAAVLVFVHGALLFYYRRNYVSLFEKKLRP
ncbi:DoxX family membrane protein [Neobacillus bataviensis]|uniref:DoxX family membrane protein n=1 Tax=Neobacillus bataviensis TaxID=220685 RepID=UPI001CBF78D3|nr:DoxX family membrane protein [Neobacillus bataviensis]